MQGARIHTGKTTRYYVQADRDSTRLTHRLPDNAHNGISSQTQRWTPKRCRNAVGWPLSEVQDAKKPSGTGTDRPNPPRMKTSEDQHAKVLTSATVYAEL